MTQSCQVKRSVALATAMGPVSVMRLKLDHSEFFPGLLLLKPGNRVCLLFSDL